MRRRNPIEMIEGSGNVYADLGFRDAEAMLVKAGLVTKIQDILAERQLTQAEAARITEVPQSGLSQSCVATSTMFLNASSWPA